MRAVCARSAAAMACKRAVFLLRGGQSEHPGGRARATADVGHDGGDIAGSLDAFQRRGHEKQARLPQYGVVFLSRRGSLGEVARLRRRYAFIWGLRG